MQVNNNANTFLPPTPVIPGFLLISNMTNAQNMVVTIIDSDENTYIPKQLVKLSVPASYGMVQADQLTGEIVSINGFDFTLNINSTNFNTFVIPGTFSEQPASLAPAGSRNLEFNNSATHVAFQSLNNRGN